MISPDKHPDILLPESEKYKNHLKCLSYILHSRWPVHNIIFSGNTSYIFTAQTVVSGSTDALIIGDHWTYSGVQETPLNIRYYKLYRQEQRMIPDWSWSCQEWSRSRPHSHLDLCTDSDTAEHQRQGSWCPGCWCCSRRRSPCNMTSNCDKTQWWRWKTRILFPSWWSWTVLLSEVQFCYLEFFSNTLKTTLLNRSGYFLPAC